VRERALREPDRIEGSEQGGSSGDRDLPGDPMGQPVDRQQRDSGDDQLSQPGGERGEARELPPQGEIERGQRRMRIRERAEWNQCAGAEEVVGGGDVIAGLVPVVGQVQQGEVREIECDEDQRKDQPQRKGLIYLLFGVLPRGKSEEGEDCCLRGVCLVERTLRGRARNGLERDAAEGLLILRQVLAEYVEERLGLLGTEIDPLKATDGDLVGRVLMCGAEGEEEIPDAGAYLHAVRVAFAVVGGFADVDPGLIVGLMDICHACARLLPQSDFKRFACVEGDGLRVWALNPFQYRGWKRIRVVRAWADQGPRIFQNIKINQK
jgi:hypothetical protein